MSNIFNPGYYDENDLKNEGFRSLGQNIQIAKNCTIIGLENISIGSNVRIDGFCSIIAAGDGEVVLGSFIHIGAYCLLLGGNGIEMRDFSTISHGGRIYSRSDDYSGGYLTNPTVPEKFTNVTAGRVILARHAIIGSSSVILPHVTIGEGSSVGALSLVTKDLDSWGIYCGCPVRKIKNRSKKLLELEDKLLHEVAQASLPNRSSLSPD